MIFPKAPLIIIALAMRYALHCIALCLGYVAIQYFDANVILRKLLYFTHWSCWVRHFRLQPLDEMNKDKCIACKETQLQSSLTCNKMHENVFCDKKPDSRHMTYRTLKVTFYASDSVIHTSKCNYGAWIWQKISIQLIYKQNIHHISFSQKITNTMNIIVFKSMKLFHIGLCTKWALFLRICKYFTFSTFTIFKSNLLAPRMFECFK